MNFNLDWTFKAVSSCWLKILKLKKAKSKNKIKSIYHVSHENLILLMIINILKIQPIKCETNNEIFLMI